MGKKSREENELSDIFKTLFGNSGEENNLALFSNNPYRRKPQHENPHQEPLSLGFGPGASDAAAEGNPKNQNQTDLVVSKTKKRERELKPYSSDASDSDSGKKKWKKRTVVDDESMERIDEENGIRKKKKKRKRDEIEDEYEARKYGGGAIETGLGPKVVVGEKRKALNDSAEMVVSKDDFDDESKLQRTVFVGNLSLKLKKKALFKEFKQFGEIESVRIRSVPIVDSKMPRKGAIIKGKVNDSVDSVHAYIVFKDEPAAQAALSHNMAKVGENHIRVDRACPPRKKLKGENAPLYDNKRTVFVGNLPFDVKDEELYQLFSGVNHLESTIEAIRVIRDPNTSLGKGIAYILFKTRDAANLVVKKKYMKLRDRDLRLYHAKSDSTPSKRENPVPAWQDNSPSKRLAVDSSDKLSNNGKPKVKAAASLSYQGLRASKSGVQKKANAHRITDEHRKLESKRLGGVEQKERNTKRPAVAARKAKQLAIKSREVNAGKGSGGAARQMGKKRKLESGTPENSHRDKKARKFK